MRPVELAPRKGESRADRIVDAIREAWRPLRPGTAPQTKERIDLLLQAMVAGVLWSEACSDVASKEAADARGGRDECAELVDRARAWASQAEGWATHTLVATGEAKKYATDARRSTEEAGDKAGQR